MAGPAVAGPPVVSVVDSPVVVGPPGRLGGGRPVGGRLTPGGGFDGGGARTGLRRLGGGFLRRLGRRLDARIHRPVLDHRLLPAGGRGRAGGCGGDRGRRIRAVAPARHSHQEPNDETGQRFSRHRGQVSQNRTANCNDLRADLDK